MTDLAWSQALLFFTWLYFPALCICSFRKKIQKLRVFFSFNPLQYGQTSKRCGRWAGGTRTVFPPHAQWVHGELTGQLLIAPLNPSSVGAPQWQQPKKRCHLSITKYKENGASFRDRGWPHHGAALHWTSDVDFAPWRSACPVDRAQVIKCSSGSHQDVLIAKPLLWRSWSGIIYQFCQEQPHIFKAVCWGFDVLASGSRLKAVRCSCCFLWYSGMSYGSPCKCTWCTSQGCVLEGVQSSFGTFNCFIPNVILPELLEELLHGDPNKLSLLRQMLSFSSSPSFRVWVKGT